VGLTQDKLGRLLDFLEEHIRVDTLVETDQLHRQALYWEATTRLPLVLTYPFPDHPLFEPFPHGATFEDLSKHLYNELVYAFETSIALNMELACDLPFTIRPNYGIGIVSSILGGLVEQIDDNPPWVRPFSTRSELMSMFNLDITDVSGMGWMPRVVETYQFYDYALGSYPSLHSAVKRVLPDLQGPFDNYELLRGSEAFTDFYTDPLLLKEGLSLTTEIQIAAAQSLLPYTTDHEHGVSYQHGVPMRGNILIRNDSPIMVSAEIYREHIAPHDSKVLSALGGGGIHSCGNIDHQMENYLNINELSCIDLGQGLMNDREKLYRMASEKKAAIIRMEATEEELITGRILEMFPTGVSLTHRCEGFEKAREIQHAYLETSRMGQRLAMKDGEDGV
jgi:hypothetical protein